MASVADIILRYRTENEAAIRRAEESLRRLPASKAVDVSVRSNPGEVTRYTSALNGLKGAFGALGIGLAAQQVVAFGVSSGRAALELDRQQRSTRALAGGTQEYARWVQIAKDQQRLFGGSLAENLAGIQGLGIVSRQSGAQLADLVDLSQRLGVLDPSQGTAGARIALSEALSGDVTSLARRYEVPRAALAKLKDESIPVAEKLKVIDDYLNDIGITGETVSGSISRQAREINTLAAAWDDYKTRVGAGLVALVTGGSDGKFSAAAGATNLLTGSAGNTEKLEGQNQLAFAQSGGSFEQYLANVEKVNQANRFVMGSFQELNQAQFQFAQSLMASGTSYDQAVLKAQQLKEVSALLIPQWGEQGGLIEQTTARLLGVASANDLYQQGVLNLVSLYRQGSITQDEYLLRLQNMERSTQADAEATARAALAKQQLANDTNTAAQAAALAAEETRKATLADVEGQVQSQLTAQAKQRLYNNALAAASAMLQSGQTADVAAAKLAKLYGFTIQAANGFLQLAAAQGMARAERSQQAQKNQEIAFKSGQTPKPTFQIQLDVAAAKAKRDFERATETAGQKVARLRGELAQTRKGSEQYYNTLLDLTNAQKALDAENKRAIKAPKIPPTFSRGERADLALGDTRADISFLERKLAGIKDKGSVAYKETAAKLKAARDKLAREQKAGARAVATDEGKELRADLALGDDVADIKRLNQELAKTKDPIKRKELQAEIKQREDNLAQKATRDQEQLNKARFDSLTDTEKLVTLEKELASLKDKKDIDSETRRFEVVKQIADLEKSIADERQRAERAALDAQLALIDDRKQRRAEDKELAKAKRVLASASSSDAQKAAAQDVLDRIPLEQQKRANEINDKLATAGAVPTDPKAIGLNKPNIPSLSTGDVPSQPLPVALPKNAAAPAGSPLAGGGRVFDTLAINVLVQVDGKDIPGRVSATTSSTDLFRQLQLAQDRAFAGN